jgi:hypothetical protein
MKHPTLNTYVEPMVDPPIRRFTSPGGRMFRVMLGHREERWKGDTIWSDTFEITRGGAVMGRIFRSSVYKANDDGSPSWSASMCPIRYKLPYDCGTSDTKSPNYGIGFDISRHDTMEECCKAWAIGADRILDYLAKEKRR